MKPIVVHYSYGLMAVSVLTSMIAAYAAFSLAERMRHARSETQRRGWLLGGSAALGIGIWSMHYLGMLAVELPVEVAYFVPTVLLSLALAIAASAVVLSVVSADKLGWRQLLGGGVSRLHAPLGPQGQDERRTDKQEIFRVKKEHCYLPP